MALSLTERISGFLFSPSATFDASRGDTIGDSFKYYIVILVIYSVLIAILTWAAFSVIAGLLGPLSGILGFVAGPFLGAAMFISMLIVGVIGVFIVGLWLHIWVYLFGGREGVEQTIKALMYGVTPAYLFGWIPFIGIIASIWAIVVGIIGIRQLHRLSTGRAALAVIIAIVVPLIIISAFIAATVGKAMLGVGM